MTGPLALVSGASGFVGSHIVDELLRQGVRVRCVLRRTSPRRWLEGKPVEIHVADLGDLPGLTAAARGASWIVHAAGLIRGHSAGAFHEANVAGTERMLRAALEAGPGLRRFLLVSSQAAAGPSRDGRPVSEGQRPQPVTAYGVTKLRAEELVLSLRERIPVVVLRPPTVYGPRDVEGLRYFRAVQQHLRPALRRDGRFSVVYAEDLARATRLALNDERAVGNVYFVAGPDLTGYAEMGGLIARTLGTWTVPVSPPRWVLFAAAFMADGAARIVGRSALWNPQKVREVTSGDWICSSARFRDALGWEPAVSLGEGVARTARWYREAGWIRAR